MFRGWSGSARADGAKILKNIGVFRPYFVPLKAFSPVASRGREFEKHRLKNTVGTLRKNAKVGSSSIMTCLTRHLVGNPRNIEVAQK